MSASSFQLDTNPYTVAVLDVSTGHITAQDVESLKKEDCTVIAYEYEYGYFVYLSEDLSYSRKEHPNFSTSFLNILKRARKLHCKYVQFDADGTIYNDLTFHIW